MNGNDAKSRNERLGYDLDFHKCGRIEQKQIKRMEKWIERKRKEWNLEKERKEEEEELEEKEEW